MTKSAAIWVLVLTLSLSACGNNTSRSETKSLYAQGLEVIQLMSEITQSAEYVDLYTENVEIKSIVQNLNGSYSVPKAVYALSITDKTLADLAELNRLDNASEGLKAFLTQRFLSSLITQLNSRGGVEHLAAASVCTVGKTFVNEDVSENVIYLYTYDNAVPIAVTFTVGENHAVSATGVFILYHAFPCDSPEEIQSFFSDFKVDVSEVLPE